MSRLRDVAYRWAASAPPEEPTGTQVAFDWFGPIASTGLVGIILLMIVLRIKIMPTYVYDDACKTWDRERERLEEDIDELKAGLRAANEVYTSTVVPTLTRVLDAEQELVELRRAEQSDRDRRRRDDS